MTGYAVKFESVVVAGGLDIQIRSLLDRMQFSDPGDEALTLGISSAAWPLFGQLWPSARILADTMQSKELHGRRVLEIGCGLALPSLVVHRRGADITASDHHPMTQAFLLENIRLNGLPPLAYRTGNWATPNPGLGKFDMVIGSDVLYEREQPDLLIAFIDLHVSDHAEIMIVDPGRPHRGAFNRGMARRGFELDDVRVDCTQADGNAYRGRLLTYRRGY